MTTVTIELENMNADIVDLLNDTRDEQRRAITSRVPLTVVSAGAGTGKTHTLARRFAWLLASDPACGVDQILTLTFTQAAATEMRERIRATLVDWHASRPQRLAHLRDSIDRLDEGYISTIHAFALRVIRESGLDLDLDPVAGFVSRPVERDFWSDFEWSLHTMSVERIAAGVPEEMNTFVRETLTDPDFPAVLEYYGVATVAKLAAAAGETFGSMMISPSAFARFDDEHEALIRKRIADVCRPHWQKAWDAWFGMIFPAIEDELAKGDNALARALAGCRVKWSSLERGKDDECVCGFYANLMLEGLADLKARKLKGRIEEVLGTLLTAYRKENDLLAEVSAALYRDDAYTSEERTVRKLLLGAAAVGWSSWESAKRRMGVLSFSDLVSGASSVLRGNASYAARFRHIMIDEFQDTDSLQDSLLVALREGWTSAPDRDAVLRTLFIVGDIKQSIYRFRHARPDLFAGYIHRARTEIGCDFIPLMRSYRMSGRVMGAVNAVFERVWEGGVMRSAQSVSSIDYDPLLPPDDLAWWAGRNSDDATEFPLEILVCRPALGLKEAGEAEKIVDLRKKLAQGVANKILSAIGIENVWDKKDGVFRKAGWGDFAVLVPKRTGSYPALEEAFAQAGIPVVFEGGREYFNRGEVQDVVNLLRLLADPEDDYALAGWLESPLSGVTPERGLALAEKARREGGALVRRFSEECPNAAAQLDRLRRKALLCSASAAILDLLEEDGWTASYRPEARGRVVANLRRAVDIVREYESSIGRNLAACADYLGREMRAFAPTEEPESASIGGVVRVMTVHASKGLEFPIVVLMGMESTPKSRSGRERAQVSIPVGVVFSKLASGGRAHSDARHKFLDLLEEWEEYERQMYVAITRAQEKLICAGIVTHGSDGENEAVRNRSWLDWLLHVNETRKLGFPTTEIKDNPEQAVDAANVRQQCHPKSLPEAGVGVRIRIRELVQSRISLSQLSASAYSLFSWCPYAYRLRYRQGLELKWELPDGDGYGGADLGSLVHWMLTHWDFDDETLAVYLPGAGNGLHEISETELRAVPPYLRHVYRSARNRAVLRAWLSAFARGENAGLFRRLKQDKKLRQEVQFRVPFSGINLIGGIDIYWEDEAGIHIRDWKITREEQSIRELYDEQIRFYALACHLLKPDVRIDAGLLHLRLGEEGQAAVEVVDWEILSGHVHRMAITAVSGPFEKSFDRCDHCPFRGVCYTSG